MKADREKTKPPGAPPRRRRGGNVAVVITLLLAFYVLSTGPTAWLRDHGYMSEKVFFSIYLPLDWVYKTSVGWKYLRPVLEQYIALWE